MLRLDQGPQWRAGFRRGWVSLAVCSRQTGAVTTGQELLEEFRRQRRAGDARLTEDDKEILRRVTSGDLADELADSLTAISDADPLLGGGPASDDD